MLTITWATCPKCKRKVGLYWHYCPGCGLNLRKVFDSVEESLRLAKLCEENKDYTNAIKLYTKAAGDINHPSSEAMYKLGYIFENAPAEFRRSIEEITFCHQCAAEMGNVKSLEWLNEHRSYDKRQSGNKKDEQNSYDVGFHSVERKHGEIASMPFSLNYKEAMSKKEREKAAFNEEKATLSGVREQMKARLNDISHKINDLEGDRGELFRNISDYSDDRGAFQRKIAKYDGEMEEISDERKMLRARVDSPYYGRFKSVCNEDGEEYDIYVGHDKISCAGVQILSWNEPICRYFKDSRKNFEHNGEHFAVRLRRDLEINQGELTAVTDLFDSESDDTVTYDAFLKNVLRRRQSQGKPSDIIVSIQKKQDLIINLPRNENFILQGCAGSGKSMILLYRLEKLRLDGVLNTERTLVITPSDEYKKLTADLRKELRISEVDFITIEYVYKKLLKQYTQRLETIPICEEENLEMANYYYSDEFYDKLCQRCEDIKSDYEKRKREYEQNKDKIDRRSKLRNKKKMLRELNNAVENEELSNLEIELKDISSEHAPRKPQIDLFAERFAKIKHPDSKGDVITRSELYANLMANYMVYGAIERSGAKAGVQLICVDEGQDMMQCEYLLLKNVYDKVCFNIYGDINQKLESKTGLASWDSLGAVGDFKKYELNENYRNTEEITAFVNEKVGTSMLPLGIEGSKVKTLSLSWIKDMVAKEMTPDITCAYIATNKRIKKMREALNGEKLFGLMDLYSVEESKGLEFNIVVVDDQEMTKNEKYIAYSRALSALYLVKALV